MSEELHPRCSRHPDAPHGFDRTASHALDRYVCDCEYWSVPEQELEWSGPVPLTSQAREAVAHVRAFGEKSAMSNLADVVLALAERVEDLEDMVRAMRDGD